MLKTDFLTMDLKALHDQVGMHVRAWLRNPANRLIRGGNRKTGEEGRYGLMVKTKGLVWHDCPGRSPGCGECQMLGFATWRADFEAYTKSYESVYSYLAHRDLDTLYNVLYRDISYYSTFADPRLIVRIHEAGDFISADHVGVYQKLAMNLPNVWFFGYTHSMLLPNIGKTIQAANLLPNFMVRESLDESRREGTGDVPTAFYGAWENAPKGSFRCPEQYGEHEIKCAACMLCLKSDRPVYFLAQKERRRRSKIENAKKRLAGIEVPNVYGNKLKRKAKK